MGTQKLTKGGNRETVSTQEQCEQEGTVEQYNSGRKGTVSSEEYGLRGTEDTEQHRT